MLARTLPRARTAARRTALRLPPQLGRAPGNEGVDALLLGRGAPRALPGGGAREAGKVGHFPPRSVVAGLAVPGLGTAHPGRPRLAPPTALGRSVRFPRPSALGCGPGPRAAGR